MDVLPECQSFCKDRPIKTSAVKWDWKKSVGISIESKITAEFINLLSELGG